MADTAFVPGVIVSVCVVLLLQRYTSIKLLHFKFGSGFMKLLAALVVSLLFVMVSGARLYSSGMGGPEAEPLDIALLIVVPILSATLIILGLIDVIGAANKMINAAIKRWW